MSGELTAGERKRIAAAQARAEMLKSRDEGLIFSHPAQLPWKLVDPFASILNELQRFLWLKFLKQYGFVGDDFSGEEFTLDVNDELIDAICSEMGIQPENYKAMMRDWNETLNLENSLAENDPDESIAILRRFLDDDPDFEKAITTLAAAETKISDVDDPAQGTVTTEN